MRQFEGRVAVVTGAASGIGRAMADRFAAEGMKVVLADVEEEPLEAAVRELRQAERDVIGVRADVRSAAAVDELARQALDAYGAVHIVCNNAGVAAGGGAIVGDREMRMWEQPLSDWQWTLDVNLWGVIHGVRTFVPILLENGGEGHIVNTASTAGVTTGPGLAIYGVSKHAVVRLSEALYFQLRELGSPVSASVLCPGGVRTRITGSGRNRPEEYLGDGHARLSAAEVDERARVWSERIGAQGKDPSEIADAVFAAVRDDRFYILTHDTHEANVRMRMEAILRRENPTLPPAAS